MLMFYSTEIAHARRETDILQATILWNQNLEFIVEFCVNHIEYTHKFMPKNIRSYSQNS